MSCNQRDKYSNGNHLGCRWELVLIVNTINLSILQLLLYLQASQGRIRTQLYVIHPSRTNCLLSWRERNKVSHFILLYSHHFLPYGISIGIDNASNTDLKAEYEPTKKKKTIRCQMRIRDKIRQNMRCTSVFALTKSNQKVNIK